MEPSKSPNEIYELFDALYSKEISAEKHRQLQHQLKNDPQAREAYYDYLDILQGLGDLSQEEQDIISFGEVVGKIDEPINSISTPPETPSKKTSHAILKYVTIIAASGILALGIEWWALGRTPWNPPISKQVVVVPQQPPALVATLVRARDCQWAGELQPKFEGQRLLTRELSLEQGVAEFRFDSGVRLIIEGPTKLSIDSSNSATLKLGRVVLHGHELAEEFELSTPRANLYDIGTEYGASVNKNGDVEVHVFQGAVRIQQKEGESPANDRFIIEAGAAKQIGQASNTDIPVRPDSFKRETHDQARKKGFVKDELIAYESFNATGGLGSNKKPEWRNGGMGWNGNWRVGVDRNFPAQGSVLPKKSLEFPRFKNDARNGALKIGLNRSAWRSLQKPIRLDTDAIYYLSFYINKSKQLDASETQYGSISFRTLNWPEDGRKLLFGMTSSKYPSLIHNSESYHVSPSLRIHKNYFYVGKIVASKNTPDQMFLRVYSKEDSDYKQEPLVWTCVSKPTFDNSVFDQVLVYVGGKGEYLFDELRIGHTWNSVTNFEHPQPPLKKAAKNTRD
ncbi:FecR domain-containing protein [Gimesia aquarii]|uniref:FecR protein n=1 Tax=Gimesia aquarii TaxID=2527964 RepID=A0A517VSN6_9PLAN|nr:FecR domain-containing protein [Gimesia aquarii]QDT96023.1 FecR protein [Gimesia aquarii]